MATTSIANVQSDIPLLTGTYLTMNQLGESARAQDFFLTFELDKTMLPYLVQTATIPTLKREVVETVGPFGVRSIQQGRWINEMELAVSFKEVVTQAAYSQLWNWSSAKVYQLVTLQLVSESNATKAAPWVIHDCWIELDGADLAVEDAIPLKISGTLHGSYFPTATGT